MLGQRVADALIDRARAGVQGARAARRHRLQEGGQGRRAADAGRRLQGRVLPQALAAQPRRAERPRPPQAGRDRRPGGLRRRPLHRRRLAGQRRGRRALRRRQRAAARAHRAQRAGAPSARTGPARPASCSSATTCSRSWSRPATCRSTPCSPSPKDSAPAVKILHHTAICLARKRIWIQNPYFIPEPEAIDAFGEAVKRGVDVRVLMPSTSGSDNPMVQHAGHRNFEKLLRVRRAAVRVPAHAAAPEGHDRRRRLERHRLQQLRRPLLRDQRRDHARHPRRRGRAAARRDLREVRAARQEIELEAWRNRGLWHKLKDNLFYLFNELL